MAANLESTAVSFDWIYGERIPAHDDIITTVLPNATNVTTEIFRFAKTQGRVELEIFAVNEITIPDAQTLTIELLWDTDINGSFANSKTIIALAPSGGPQVISAGGLIAEMLPESEIEHYAKIRYTASSDLSAFSVTSFTVPVA